jgi:hypothetical protein
VNEEDEKGEEEDQNTFDDVASTIHQPLAQGTARAADRRVQRAVRRAHHHIEAPRARGGRACQIYICPCYDVASTIDRIDLATSTNALWTLGY